MDFLRLTSVQSIIGKLTCSHEDERDSSNAFALDEKIKICLSAPRSAGLRDIVLEFFDESGMCNVACVGARWNSRHGADDIFVCKFDASVLGVRLAYFRFSATAGSERLYSHLNDGNLLFNRDSSKSGFCQITVYECLYAPPERLYGGTIYHIFVDRFNRGGRSLMRDDSRLVDDWSAGIPEYPAYSGAPLKNNSFYGGTLDGIRSKLDYLVSLGVTAIYLSPIFESVSNHKYDTADYTRVDEGFGGDEALADLIGACNSRGISLILDGVFNHTGADSVYFNRYSRYGAIGAYQSTESDYYEWFNFKKHPDDYESWWGIEILPRINPDVDSCRKFFVGEGGVIDKYSAMGVYGFRLDVADELSDDFIESIKRRLSVRGESVLYGEVWEDASNKIAYGQRKQYYLGKELDGVMNYPLRKGVIEYIRDHNPSGLSYALNEVFKNTPKRIADAQMNFLGTHDTVRIITALGGGKADGLSNDIIRSLRMTSDEREIAVRRVIAAYTIVGTLPGVPTIFYGDEAGLEGYSDPFNRMPYPWGNEDSRLIEHYRKIGDLRRNHRLFGHAGLSIIHLSSDALIFSRVDGEDVAITVYNNSKNVLSIDFKSDVLDYFLDSLTSKTVVPSGVAKVFITNKQNKINLDKSI